MTCIAQSAAMPEQVGVRLLAQVFILETGVLAVRSDIASVTIRVTDSKTKLVNSSLTIVAADTMFTEAQAWEYDDIGYCWAWVLPAAARPLGDRSHFIDLIWTPVSGEAIGDTIEIPTRNLKGF